MLPPTSGGSYLPLTKGQVRGRLQRTQRPAEHLCSLRFQVDHCHCFRRLSSHSCQTGRTAGSHSAGCPRHSPGIYSSCLSSGSSPLVLPAQFRGHSIPQVLPALLFAECRGFRRVGQLGHGTCVLSRDGFQPVLEICKDGFQGAFHVLGAVQVAWASSIRIFSILPRVSSLSARQQQGGLDRLCCRS